MVMNGIMITLMVKTDLAKKIGIFLQEFGIKLVMKWRYMLYSNPPTTYDTQYVVDTVFDNSM